MAAFVYAKSKPNNHVNEQTSYEKFVIGPRHVKRELNAYVYTKCPDQINQDLHCILT